MLNNNHNLAFEVDVDVEEKYFSLTQRVIQQYLGWKNCSRAHHHHLND